MHLYQWWGWASALPFLWNAGVSQRAGVIDRCLLTFREEGKCFFYQIERSESHNNDDNGSGAKVCVSNSKESPVLICAYGLAHLETPCRLWAVFGLSSAQNLRFTLFFDTACTLFAQNSAKVYCSSGVPPRVPGWRPQKSSAVREITQESGWDAGKSPFARVFSPETRSATQLIHSVRSFFPSMMPDYQLACGLRIRRTRYNSNSK